MPEAKSTLEKLRQEEREARRNLILDAAISLFGGRPFNQVGMRDIAAEAGISAASIYRYFSDRDELFVEALFREASAITGGLVASLRDGADDSLTGLCLNYVTYLLDHEAFFQMMTHFMVDGGISDEALERFNATERQMLDVFAEELRARGAGDEARMMAHALFAALNGVLITFRNYPGRQPDEVRRHMIRLTKVAAGVFARGVAKAE